MSDKPIVWSNGGGTQSAAIAVMILQGILPRPDIVCMADTSREVSETWTYLDSIVRPAFSKIGIEIHVIPHSYSYWDIVKEEKQDILIPAFTTQSGDIGKLPTFCSNEWKQRPVRRWLRERGVEQCFMWLGISTDEMERMRFSDTGWITNVYPLIEIVPTSRHRCVSIVENYGWPTPPKSRCWMCPNMSPYDWRTLKGKYPDDFGKAVLLERELQVVDKYIFLHKLAIPLDEAVSKSEEQSDMFDGCDSGYCWT